MQNSKSLDQNHYRVVWSGGIGKLHKVYFKSYESALSLFESASSKLHPYGYCELQEREGSAYMTIEQTNGGAF